MRRNLITAAIDGELVVFDPESAKVHQLDPVGAVIWQLLDGEATLAELIADLAEGFGVPEAQVRADVAALLDSLREHDLLDDGTATAPPPSPPAMAAPPRPDYLIDPPAP